MTDFWFNHFNVFAQKGADLWMITTYEREAIRPHALGKFRDLLLATAQSPAMLFYLDNWLSASEESRLPRPPNRQGQRQPQAQPPQAQPAEMQPQAPRPPQQRRQGVNENYARELLELHTLGVNGGYSQKDVQEIARCFTGWTIDRPNQGGGFIFRRWAHDSGSKTVLGVGIPAGGGIEDGYRVINILARHPSTARFISRKLCQRFVADDPPAVLVERIAQTFLKTDGDIRQVLGAIFSSAEFNSAGAFRSKLKSPLELIASAIRTLGGDTNGAPALHEWIRRMGGPLYQHQAPTGYSEDSSSWMNTGAFVNRINFAVAVANNQIPGTRYKSERFLKPESSLANGALIDRLAASTIHTELSPDSRKAVETALGQNPSGQSLTRAIELMLGTVEFQRK
jgi:uncharacterized protein (DUF1800 family)